MRVALASDHAGASLVEHLGCWLERNHYTYENLSSKEGGSVDYPYYATAVVQAISEGKVDRGVLICSTGTGMCIAANRFPKIRAANCWNEYMTSMARLHNDIHILCLGQGLVAFETAERILKIFLETPASLEERHIRRVKAIDQNTDISS